MPSVVDPRRRGRVATRQPTWWIAALIAGTTAMLTFALHHSLPSAQAHAIEGAMFVVLIAAALGWTPAVAAARRLHPAPPLVVVAPPTGQSIRRATPEDVAFMAALHADALPHGFFVALGPRFLRGYHRTFLDSPYAIAEVIEITGQPVGVLLGILEPRNHRRWTIKRRGLLLAALAFPALLGRPVVAVRFLRSRARRYTSAVRTARREAGPATRVSEPAVVSHVAVLDGARGYGAGSALIDSFTQTAAAAGATDVELVTLAGGLAESFYRAQGWTALGDASGGSPPLMTRFRRTVAGSR